MRSDQTDDNFLSICFRRLAPDNQCLWSGPSRFCVCVCACVRACVCWRAPVHFGLISPLSHSVLSFIIMFLIMYVVWSCIRIKGDVSLEKKMWFSPPPFLYYAHQIMLIIHIIFCISVKQLITGTTGIYHLVQLELVQGIYHPKEYIIPLGPTGNYFDWSMVQWSAQEGIQRGLLNTLGPTPGPTPSLIQNFISIDILDKFDKFGVPYCP